MKKIFGYALIGLLTMGGNYAIAQSGQICGNELIQKDIDNNPYTKAYFEDYYKQYAAENMQMAATAARAESKTTDYNQVIIPVVFHVLLNKAQFAQILDTAGLIDRINSQLAVMNEDFNANNADISGVPDGFKPLIGNAHITFQLARRDANGKSKLGIVYKLKDASFTGYGTQDLSVKRDVSGGSSPWDYTKYLNIWITNILPPTSGGQVLGYGFNSVYSQNTYTDPALAGIVLHYLAFGRKTALSTAFYSNKTEKGRTLTHELGHFFNIWHIWGITTPAGTKNCNEDDGIQDTPLQEEANTGCSIGIKKNCTQAPNPFGEMYMNYMDYSTDLCTKFFSKGQVDRMRTETAPGGQVYSLTQHPELAFWPADVSAMEYNNSVEVGPNPSTGIVNVFFFEKYNQLNTITVTNTMGQLVKNITVTDQEKLNYGVDLTDVAKGMYIIQLHFDEGVISRKVLIQ